MLRKLKRSSIYRMLAKQKHRLEDKKINKGSIKLNQKIIVIESDDWGSIRTPSKQTLDKLQTMGDSALADPFLKYDSLESVEDLQELFNVLSSIKDSQGRSLPITANFAMANAKFDSILKNGVYEREPFYETYERYFGNKDVLELIKKGQKEGFFVPQLHCLEHLNVVRWMSDYKKGKKDVKQAIELGMYGISSSFSENNKFGYMDAFNYSKKEEQEFLEQSVDIATKMFEDTFGYASKTFTASCYIWDDFLEEVLYKKGIKHIQSGVTQILPFATSGKEEYLTKTHKTGERNALGQLYTVRNCEFEPAYNGLPERSIERCFEQIKTAFSCRAPAIITSHRLNYIGSISKENREKNLEGLRKLFERVLSKYDDVIFMTSDELGSIINGKGRE